MPQWPTRIIDTLHRIFSRPVSGSEQLFYCYAHDCLAPWPLASMGYGCAACQPPRPVAPDLPLPVDCTHVWAAHLLCSLHHLPMQPYCPGCETPIHPKNSYPPISLWGGVNAGKTVCSAVLAKHIHASRCQTTDGLLWTLSYPLMAFDISPYKQTMLYASASTELL